MSDNKPNSYKGQPPLILIGPKGVGKSTVARLLAHQLQLPHTSMDQHCWRYYVELPEINNYFQQVPNSPAPEALDVRSKRFLLEQVKANSPQFSKVKAKMELHATRRLLEEFPRGILDFGAGHSVFQHAEDCQTLKTFLSGKAKIFLLLPSEDVKESMQVLARNLNAQQRIFHDSHLAYYLNNPSNRYLADEVILTRKKTPEQTATELISRL
ncbi:MAG: AAA family ATPase [Bacteroidota bacterium]